MSVTDESYPVSHAYIQELGRERRVGNFLILKSGGMVEIVRNDVERCQAWVRDVSLPLLSELAKETA